MASATYNKTAAILQRRELEAQAIQTEQKNIECGHFDVLDKYTYILLFNRSTAILDCFYLISHLNNVLQR